MQIQCQCLLRVKAKENEEKNKKTMMLDERSLSALIANRYLNRNELLFIVTISQDVQSLILKVPFLS